MRGALILVVLVLVLVVAAACGDNASPVAVLQVQGTPDFIAYRDGTGPWRTPALDHEDGAWSYYRLDVTADYIAVASCASGTTHSLEQINAVWPESEWVVWECASRVTTPAPVTVSGQMKQAGFVDIGDAPRQHSNAMNWSYQVEVTPGPTELIALDAKLVAIRHDQVISGPTVEDPIDLSVEGAPMLVVPVSVSGMDLTRPIDFIHTLFTAHTMADLNFADQGNTVAVVPASVLNADDFQSLWFLENDGPGASSRDVYVSIGLTAMLSPIAVAIPPKLIVAFATTDDFTTTWDPNTLPHYTTAQVYLWSKCGPIKSQNILATRAWLELHGAAGVTFDVTAPGFDPAWTIDLTQPYTHGLQLADVENQGPLTISTDTSRFEDVVPAMGACPQPVMRLPPTASLARARARARWH